MNYHDKIQAARARVIAEMESIFNFMIEKIYWTDPYHQSCTRSLFTLLHPDVAWPGWHTTPTRDFISALCRLEEIGFVRLDRQGDPAHANGERNGLVGLKIRSITLVDP